MPAPVQKQPPQAPGSRSATAGKRPRRTPVERSAASPRREALLASLIELSARSGYPNVSVAEVSGHAGVSTRTFYELFEGKEDCLLAAHRRAAALLLGQDAPPARGADGPGAARERLARVLTAARDHPDAARLLAIEALAGGERVRAERERVRPELEARAGRLLDPAAPRGQTLDIPATAVLGALRGVVSRRLRTSSADRLPELASPLVQWLLSYATPARRGRWSEGAGPLLPAAAVGAPDEAYSAPRPAPLPRGRHRLPPQEIARSRRTRIIRGTAEVTLRKGYAETTVSEIVAAAGISREVFYEHFESRRHAFLAAQRYGTHDLLQTCTRAYFAAPTWPERVWAVLGVLIDVAAANPALAHLRLVECYAAGAAAIENTEELGRSLTIFLEEGFGVPGAGDRVPPLAREAIAGAIFEAFRTDLGRGEVAMLQRRLPELTYLATAPFLGPAAAVDVIERLRGGALAAAG